MRNIFWSMTLVVACLFGAATAQAQKQVTTNNAIVPGEVWNDTDGNPINAHGGGILYHEGTYYWYGEYKKGKTILPEWATWECYRTDVTGVSCYSSKDLLNWKFEGIVLPAVKDDQGHDLHTSKVLERPKVIYNPKTKKFVMWAHVESADYSKACAGVAISDSPTGEFTYLGSFRPNGAMSRDQTVFVDDDGRAYHFYSSENNATLYISELTDDYQRPSGRYTRMPTRHSMLKALTCRKLWARKTCTLPCSTAGIRKTWKTHVMYGFHSPSKVIKSPFPGVTNGTSTALLTKVVLKPAKELSY